MTPLRKIARLASRRLEDLRARALLRGARIGRGVQVFGRPNVVCEGTLVFGDGVIVMATPAAVTFVVERGASIEVGDGACIESGATLRARRRIVIAPGAHVEAGAVLDDAASDARELVITSAPGDRAARQVPGRSDSRVRAVLASIVPGVADLGPRDDVRAAPGWDSLAALRAVVELEHALGASLPHDLFTRVHTIEALERAARGEAA